MRTAAATRTETFAALGTQIDVVTRPWHGEALRIVEDVMADVDRTCSRFRADSDLTRVNASPGRWVAVSRTLAAAVELAVEAAAHTDGLVSPCLGRTLRSLGYDADLDVVRQRPADHRTGMRPRLPRIDAWRDIGIDADGAVRVPADVELDLGATAKAFAADLAALTVHDELGVDVAVSAGGDVRIVNATGDLWPVRIAERPGDPVAETVYVIDGGIATSSTTHRRWTADGVVRHHLVDPRSGRPSTGTWRTVTAAGPTCVAANVASTAAIILGADAVGWLDEREVWARLVAADGSVTRLRESES